MNGRAASRACVELVKDTLVRDGATVEAVPMAFMHIDGYVVTIHGDDFNHTMDNNRTQSLGRVGPHCSQKRGRFFRRAVVFAAGA